VAVEWDRRPAVAAPARESSPASAFHMRLR
jgi:hypothetical protein